MTVSPTARPGVIAPGRTERGLVSLTDIGATLIEIAGAEPLSLSDGHSLLASMRGTGGVLSRAANLLLGFSSLHSV